nr:MAG TPA: Lysophosphatidic acid receptor 1, G protein-coupled receptor, DE [Bacteriophage sp.]
MCGMQTIVLKEKWNCLCDNSISIIMENVKLR